VILLTALLAVLLLAAWVTYGDARVKEAADRAEALRLKSMDLAMTDMTGRCWVCTAEANPLELVDSGHRFDLMCGHCAHVRKTMNPHTRSRVA
jgi:hypothetical protein